VVITRVPLICAAVIVATVTICAPLVASGETRVEESAAAIHPATRASAAGNERSALVRELPGPYCGIYCVWAALQASAKTVPFDELLESKYISSPEGSSASELAAAARDHGFSPVLVGHLTTRALKASGMPIVLHATEQGSARVFRHWILYIGDHEGRAVIVDPPNAPELISYAQLLARTDGIGIVLARQELSIWRVALPDYAVFLSILLVVLSVAALVARVFRLQVIECCAKSYTGAAFSVACLVGASVVIGAIASETSAEGFFHNRDAVRAVAASFGNMSFPDVSTEEMQAVSSDGNALVFDARYARDYSTGHIPGAVSMPVNAGLSYRRSLLKGVPLSHPIIIYCQSAGCDFDDQVASLLAADGYRNVKLYHGGWQRWISSSGDRND